MRTPLLYNAINDTDVGGLDNLSELGEKLTSSSVVRARWI